MKSFFLRNEPRLIFGWFFTTAIGFVLGAVFLKSIAFRFVPLSLVHSKFDWFWIMLGVAAGLATGLAVGFFQWVILRNYISHAWLWIVVTPVGMASGIFLGRFFSTLAGHYLGAQIPANIWALSFWTILFVEGVSIGLIQLIVIMKSFHRPWIWILANGVAWVLAYVLEYDVLRPIFYPCCFDYIFGHTTESIIFGVVGVSFGIITGVPLLWLVRQNHLIVQNAA
jgi:hypothetical protein